MGAGAAAIGGAALSAFSSNSAASKASSATRNAAAASAAATVEATKLQVAEIRRQFNFQMQILQPQIQQQFNAQAAYSNMLGLTGPDTGAGPGQPGAPGASNVFDNREQLEFERNRDAEIRDIQREIRAVEEGRGGTSYSQWSGGKGGQQETVVKPDEKALRKLRSRLATVESSAYDPGLTPNVFMPSGQAAGGFQREDGQPFIDPNLDPRRLSDTETLSDTVQGNLLAGTGPDDDPYRGYIDQNRLAAGSLDDDVVRSDIAGRMLSDGAAGTGVYGNVFQESPGYQFQVEEMERQLERVGSAGGPNIGGRAIIEAQRRAQGLADSEYYNWAQGRERDLVRQGQAEAQDAGRLDQASFRYGNLQVQDQQRGDRAYENYLSRRAGDASRLDQAAARSDALQATDLQRMDQAYYNYLQNVSRQAGFGGGSAAQAVGASGAAGQSVANAYGNQAPQLSNIFQNQGANEANIAIGNAANINNSIQSGLQNWYTLQNSQPQQPTGGYKAPPGPHS